ncbi:hypothetical protein [Oryza sativa Japonica Group]|uniref:Uncharacterized protein P0694A04.24 n=1 Tax=Oryza sativa subsp. japonica TaxID=39947 RepID=Q94DB6_ORYSJ|nr:hypothetical protein [Oryza sativa Japonica Group]
MGLGALAKPVPVCRGFRRIIFARAAFWRELHSAKVVLPKSWLSPVRLHSRPSPSTFGVSLLLELLVLVGSANGSPCHSNAERARAVASELELDEVAVGVVLELKRGASGAKCSIYRSGGVIF